MSTPRGSTVRAFWSIRSRTSASSIPIGLLPNSAPSARTARSFSVFSCPRAKSVSTTLKRITALSEGCADKFITITNRQNLDIHGVDIDQVVELKRETQELDHFHETDDCVACVGSTYCPLAVTETRRIRDMLKSLVLQAEFDLVRDGILINVTGCPNSCSPCSVVD